jgi:hypothetical protein
LKPLSFCSERRRTGYNDDGEEQQATRTCLTFCLLCILSVFFVCLLPCLLHHLQARCGHVMQLHMLQVLFAVIQALNTLTRVGDCVSESLLFAKLFESACFVVELLYKSDTHYTPKYILVWWSGLATFSVRYMLVVTVMYIFQNLQ